MISNERLQELINEGATIYTIDKTVNYPIPLFLDEHYVILAKEDGAEECLAYTHERIIEGKGELLINLYETQEQAEWALKYHATRIEELNLPYWTDIVRHKDDDVYKIASFRTKNGNKYNLLFKKGDLSLWNVRESRVIWVYLATEENYTKLCDLCVKLFKEN